MEKIDLGDIDFISEDELANFDSENSDNYESDEVDFSSDLTSNDIKNEEKSEDDLDENVNQTEKKSSKKSSSFSDDGLENAENSVENNDDKILDDDEESKPTGNIYSKLTELLTEDRFFDSDLLEEKEISTADDFRDLLNKMIDKKLGEKNARISAALENGVEPQKVISNEKTLDYLYKISPEDLVNNDENTINLRRNIIYQDAINRGYNRDKAIQIVQRAEKYGTSIEDAKEALDANIEFFKARYQNDMSEAKQRRETEAKNAEERITNFKKLLEDTSDMFGENLSSALRAKAYENITKPLYSSQNTKEKITALQKYQEENPNDFVKNIGILFTLTDGFKNLDKLVAPKANKKIKNTLAELETLLREPSRANSDSYVGTNEDATREFINNKNWTL